MYEKDKRYYLAAPKYLGVESLGDSGVNLRFAVNVKEKNIFDARRRLNRDIRVLFQEKAWRSPSHRWSSTGQRNEIGEDGAAKISVNRRALSSDCFIPVRFFLLSRIKTKDTNIQA